MKENQNQQNLLNTPSSKSQLLIEYNSLKQYSPSGVYTVPCISDIYLWESVIFIRQGFYKDGVFSFKIKIPKDYPQTRPSVFFNTFIYHPLINPDTGEVSLDPRFENWRAGKDFIFSILNYIKQIFYFQDDWTHSKFVLNAQALSCALQDPLLFSREAQSCVHSPPSETGGLFTFKDFSSVHNIILTNIRKSKEKPSDFIKYFKDNFL
jgi:ubiquitin-protein ligase